MTTETAAPKLRVTFVAAVPNFYGGAERTLVDLLRNPSVTPSLCVPAEGPLSAMAQEAGIPFRIVPFGRAGDVRRPVGWGAAATTAADTVQCARDLSAAAAALGADLVHANGMKPNVLAAIARRLGAVPWQLVAHVHDIPGTRTEHGIWRGLFATSDAVIAVAPVCVSGPVRSHVSVVPNGLDVPPLPPWGQRPRPMRVGFVGRYARVKGLHLLPAWFEAARAQGVDCVLVLRGRPAPEDAAYFAEISRRLAQVPEPERVHDEGFRPRQRLYDDLDVVLVPSDTPDAHPYVIKEAQAQGIPVIAYPSGGIPAMIRHGVTGFLAADADAFVAALRELTTSPEAHERIRRQAWDHARATFGMDAFYRRINAVYDRLAAFRRRAKAA